MVTVMAQAVNYINSCRLSDGGYFFARVLPSSGMDTYFAVKSLSMLKLKPDYPEGITRFFLDDFKEDNVGGIPGLSVIVEVLNELGQMTDENKRFPVRWIKKLQDKAGSFGEVANLNIEVPSELESTYRAVRILEIINAKYDKEKVSHFVNQFINADGGYGSKNYSTLASTFYATEINKLLGFSLNNIDATRAYLKTREKTRQMQFIEDLYWLVRSLVNLGEVSAFPESVIELVQGCQRPNGGFARSPIIGIPTLEYTFYAVSILKVVWFLDYG